MKKWETIGEFKIHPDLIGTKFKIDDLIKVLLANRNIQSEKEIEEFLNPKLETVTPESVGIKKTELKKALVRIKRALEKKEQIVVFGDYDADGICATAILWETLNSLGVNVMPYIPHRVEEGYGLSVIGIKNLETKFKNPKLIITVDNGIVANEGVEFANKQGIDVIITDHHIPGKKLPKAHAIIHSTKVCGGGVSWLLSNVILSEAKNPDPSSPLAPQDDISYRYLDLAAIATIGDLMPLIGPNRAIVKYGIEKLRNTKRIGLLEIFKEAILEKSQIGVYQIGHIVAPRLNATGRMDYAMDSLRLLCTTNKERAGLLAQKLGQTNRERQELTITTTEHAKRNSKIKIQKSKLLFISHESYQQGVIGLVAGKLVEEFYRPAIVVSKGEKFCKASARSVSGFNIIEFIREASEFLTDAGGHPMAAGFTVETEKLELLQNKLEELADKLLDGEKLTRKLRIDCELDLSVITDKLYDEILKLSPFGMGNPEPVFVSRGVQIEDLRIVGRQGKHLKLKFRIQNSEFRIDGIGFGMGDLGIKTGDKIDIAYTIDSDSWNGNKKLQLKIKDINI